MQTSSLNFTAMDYNEDGIVDYTDSDAIMHDYIYGISYTHRNKTLYAVPDYSTRTYKRHDCSSTSSITGYQYELPVNLNLTSEIEEPLLRNYPSSPGVDDTDNENSCCVYLHIKDYNNNNYYASGVVVDTHLIATSAANLYKNAGFVKSVTAEVLDTSCFYTLETVNADYIHVPLNYINSSPNANYDYGLIYVSEDLSDYVADIGIMSNTFLANSSNNLVTSGFTLHYGVRRRYYSYGSVVPIYDNYRFCSNAYNDSDKSGGMVYFASSRGSINHHSYVGVPTNTSGTNTYGVRITPTILHFFYQNPELTP